MRKNNQNCTSIALMDEELTTTMMAQSDMKFDDYQHGLSTTMAQYEMKFDDYQ